MNTNRLTSAAGRIGRFLRVFATALALAGTASLPALAQPAGLVNAGAFSTLVGAIQVGQTQVDVVVPVSGLNSLRIQAIVPVVGAQIRLIDPSGNVVIQPTDAGISFLDGSALVPPLPGGVFITPDVNGPANGNWVLRATFPPATAKTIALLTVFADSPYRVGIVLTSPTYRVGQPVPLGLLAVFNGLPISGLQPSFTLRKDGQTLATLPAADSGQPADFDGRAGDGIYSQGYTFTSTGRYEVVGAVDIPVVGGSVQRTATGFIDIQPVSFTLNSVTGSVVAGTGGCIARLDVVTSASALLPGTYATAATLRAPGGQRIVKRTSSLLGAPGALSSVVSFTAREIRQQLAQGGAFVVDPLDVVSFAGESPTLEVRRANAVTFPSYTLAQFCTDPIEVGSAGSVTPVLRSGHIGQLNFQLPIRVNTAGAYTVSFKITDGNGAEVGQFGLSPSLVVGDNTIGATVLADRLQKSDGPFSIDSVLVVRGSTTAQASRVAVPGSNFSRWQFFPTITADLNADGNVDAADNQIVLSFRNTTPLQPGDRRDINRDGRIDVRDSREVVLRACQAPNCPRN